MGFSTLVHITLPLWGAPEFSLVCLQISADCIFPATTGLLWDPTEAATTGLLWDTTEAGSTAWPFHCLWHCTPHNTDRMLHSMQHSTPHDQLLFARCRAVLPPLIVPVAIQTISQAFTENSNSIWSDHLNLVKKKITFKMLIQFLYKPSLSLFFIYI